MNKKLLILSFAVLAFCACNTGKIAIVKISSQAIPIDAASEKLADRDYQKFLEPFKQQLDRQMNEVIGYASESMIKQRPECSLTNFASDAYAAAASEFLGQEVDIAINNFGGLRTNIPAGNVTNRTIFELMPFDNQLVIVWLKGSYLEELIQFYASVNGEGVLGIRFKINRDKKAENITVQSKAINPDAVYAIATNDYCAAGNDGMFALAKYDKIVDTGITVRDAMLAYVKKLTVQGKPVTAAVDGRVGVE